MKRHPALQDLSRDHHLVLIKMQKLRRALEAQAEWADLTPLVDDLLRFYDSDMVAHFREEDEIVVPKARRFGGKELRAAAAGVSAEHSDFRTRFAELRENAESEDAARPLLEVLHPLLTAHIQGEEGILFQGVQEVLDEKQLEGLWQASHDFRKANRSPNACGLPPTKKAPS